VTWQSFLEDISHRDMAVFAGGLALGGLLIGLLLRDAHELPVEPPVTEAGPVEAVPAPDPGPEPGLEPAPGSAGLSLMQVAWDDLTAWPEDDLSQALATFNRSCEALLRLPPDRAMDGGDFAGTADDWQPVCELAAFVPADNDAARAFFEEAFVPFSVAEDGDAEGLFTGYYVPVLQGRLTRDANYDVPLLARPDDLVSVDLGRFDPDHAGQQIYGRVEAGKLTPYFSRAEIETGAWSNPSMPLIWLADPVEAFFLHIQGSGMVQLADGSMVRMGFAGKNGLAYTSVGRYLINQNLLGQHEASMQGIKSWVADDPAARIPVLHQNASYVFFHRQVADGAIGALDVPLTARRSLAVDRGHIPLGAPLWLSLAGPNNLDVSNRLMIAQDTGGAIKGAVRGDFYWGEGDAAGSRAGRMKQAGHYYILLPKELAGRQAP
jgi:membrane-bound lytic murein transglycosylase A